MKCKRCGVETERTMYRNFSIHRCPNCFETKVDKYRIYKLS